MDAQGKCLVNSKDPIFMTDIYDHYLSGPSMAGVRRRLQESPHDLCLACLALDVLGVDSPAAWHNSITRMEMEIERR